MDRNFAGKVDLLVLLESRRLFSDALCSDKPQRKVLLSNLLLSIVPTEEDDEEKTRLEKFLVYLPMIARLAVECPFTDVRKRCASACTQAKKVYSLSLSLCVF